jgi:hypothetical protein
MTCGAVIYINSGDKASKDEAIKACASKDAVLAIDKGLTRLSDDVRDLRFEQKADFLALSDKIDDLAKNK